MVEAKRGTATVLFTDLVGSTALRSALGEVAADELRRRHDEALGSVVADAGGEVVKSIGDGIMATFGSAAGAIEAGIGAQQVASRLGADLGVDVRLRVGMSAGDVSFEDGDCFGLPVVEAARLEAAAEPGQILCSAIVQALAGGRVEVALEPIGELSLKGLDAPVVAFAVPWSTLEASEAPREPFAGRGEALGEISALIDGLAEGVGSALLVGGEPGAGKTRLVTEALRREHRVDVVWGHSYGGEVIPLGPVVEILDSLAGLDSARLRRCAAHHDRIVAELSPVAAAAWGDVVVPDRLDLVQARQRLHSAVTDTLANWAAEGPLAVVFDDLHWADELSVSLMRALARRTTTAGLLTVGTYRPTDLDRQHPWGEALAVLVREVDLTQIDLDGLAPGEVGELVAELAGQGLDPGLVDELAMASGGNPLFVLEISRQLAESGAFQRDEDGVWHRAEEVPLDLPRGLRQVIGGRVGRLDDTTQEFLAVAAVFEAPFEMGLVAELAGVTEDEALACVEVAEAARLVEATHEFDVYEFSHAMVRQTLYEEANPSRLVRLHRRIAEAMEARITGSATYSQAAALSHHYSSSAVMPGAEAGVRWAVEAGLAARDRSAFSDALRNIEIANDLAHGPAGVPLGARIAKPEIHAAIGDVAATRRECAAVIGDLDGPAAAALYASCVRSLESAGADLSGVWDLAAEGLDACGDRRDESWITLRNYDLFGKEMRDPAYVGIPTDSPEKQELASVVIGLGSPQIARYIHRDRAQILSHPQPHGVALALHAGEFRRARTTLSEHVDHAKRNGLGGEELVYRGILARMCHALGEIDAQQEIIAEGLDLYRRTPYANAALQFETGLIFPATVFEPLAPDTPHPLPHPEFGQAHTLLNHFELQLGAVRSSTHPSLLYVKATVLIGNATWDARWGQRARAFELLQEGLPALVTGPAGATNYPLLPSLYIGALLELGELRWIDEIRAAATKIIQADFHYPEHDVRSSLGRLEAHLGNRAAALHWFAESRQCRTEQGARPHIALNDLREAEAELQLGGPDARIRQLLDQAQPELERIGASARVADCERVRSVL